jgi:D-3-phosphoglycerate dehydrogenase
MVKECKWEPLGVGHNNPEELVELARGYTAVIAGGEVWSEKAICGVKNSVKVIARFGAGYDKVDLKAAEKYGIAVTNAPGLLTEPVAEGTLGLLINLMRKISLNDRVMRNGIWSPKVTRTLFGKTIGIIGFGGIGQCLAKLLSPFNNRILVYDTNPDIKLEELYDVKYVSWEALLQESDILSLHLPLNQSTEGIINNRTFSMMKKGAIIVNTGRGKIICESDLIEALKNGRLAGAALDVYEKEPIDIKSELLKMDEVVLSPHATALTCEAFDMTLRHCIKNIDDVIKGKKPENLLNDIVF